MPELNDVEIEQLADNCRFENARFQRENISDPTPCFELLRQGLAELNSMALDHVHAIYLPKMEWWASRYIGSQDIGEDAEYFAVDAFFNFYRAAIGEQFDRKFQSLPKIIRFMQVCVRNGIWQYLRKDGNRTIPLPDTDLTATDRVEEDSELAAIWARICELLSNPEHQLLARLVVVLEMKPSEIVEFEEYSAIWPRARDISIRLYHIRKILSDDDTLRNWMNDS
jgi:DNA-directed RNA polymerase specialized sigma24 family protein